MKNKIILITICLIVGNSAFSQITNTSVKDTEVDYSSATAVQSGSIKLIDNQGTIKYLQVKNGITSLTNASASAGNETVTTLSLGGVLSTDTFIDASGVVFGLKGSDQETGNAATSSTLNTSGYTLAVFDEATGEIKKLLVSALDVVGASDRFVVAATPLTTYTVAIAGLSLTPGKTFVFRNGVKLTASGTTPDYTTSGSTVTIDTSIPLFSGDIIEVQYIN
jgi:hypothetical protein